MGQGMQGIRISGLLAVVVIAAALLSAPAMGARETVVEADEVAGPDRVRDEVIVQFDRGAGADERADARVDAGTANPENLGSRGLEVVRIADGGSVAETIRELEADPSVKFAEPNAIDHPFAEPNDPLFGQLWGMQNTGQAVAGTPGTADADIDAPAAWDIGTGDPSTVIAIMDSGASLNHPDLAPQLWQNPGEVGGNGVDDDGNGFVDDVNGYDFVDGDADPTDVEDHGTHVSGTALGRGDDGTGITGVSQRASLMVLRVCAPQPTSCVLSAQLAALNYAAAEGADVLNASLGGASAVESQARRSTIFSHPQILHVFAAGNDGDNVDAPPGSPTYPCAHAPQGSEVDNTLCVANTTATDGRSASSNFGPTSVDLGAPGNVILSSSIFHDVFFDRVEAGAGDFAVNWPTNGGWERTNEAPLVSFGITDSEGANYLDNQNVAVTSRAVAVPPGHSTCELQYFRSRDLEDGFDQFFIEVLRNSAVVFTASFSTDATPDNVVLPLNPGVIAAGGNVQIRLRLQTDGSITDNGVHIDNMRLQCAGNGHEFLAGTSMASPHVAGAAGLLASRNPGADSAELRQKILSTVDPIGSLSGLTVTGGRLNIGSAMAAMPADTSITGGPAEGSTIGARSGASRQGGGPVKGAFATFSYASNDPATGFQCSVDGAAFSDCGGGTQTLGPLPPGPHSVAVRSVDPRGNADTTPARRNFAVESDPPETKISKSPKKRTDSRKAKFKFTSDEPNSTFQCRIDKKPFKPCTSPRKLKKVKPKGHRFQVVATDAVGNVDPTAAKKKWRVEP